MQINSPNYALSSVSPLKACALCFLLLFIVSCGVETGNEFLDAPENIVDTSNQDSNAYKPLGEIPDVSLADITVRGRPYIDKSLGYNVIRSDMGTLLRGVSLSTDGGDPYNAANAMNPPMPTLQQLQDMVNNYGFNTLHVYLEGDAAQNPNPAGINEALADHLVEITREAKMYLIITIGNNGENGAIHSMEKVLAFWDLYGAKYKDETHVIYEAHNEPVVGSNAYWTTEDWEKQAQMYQKIREVAPDTMVLLGSFMSFFGGSQAIKGADGLAEQFPDIWKNAGFAFHAYWNLPQVESTIEAFEASDDYPALLCTEFWPGDTKNGYNEVFESHQIGWTQFEWLGANDLELDRIKNYMDTYGTAWRPDNPTTTWPASGTPNIPIDQKIGLYSRADKAFLGLDDNDRVVAGDRSYDGVGSDEFIVVDAGDDGHIALLADNGRYLSVSDYGQPLVATARKIGVNQKFKWLELPTGDIALRPWSGSGHLIGTIPSADGDGFGLTGSMGAGIKRGGANTYRMVTSYTDSVDPLPELPETPPGPFFGSPMPVPTSGNGDHPLDSLAPNGRLWASDYDNGGEGISYHDTGAVNLGEAYRASEAVDVQSSSEGHTSVGFFEPDEWLEYSIDVAQAGNYTLTLRTASWGGGFISLESDCEKLTGNLSTPDTTSWDIWQDMTVDITLKAGVQKLRVVSGGNMNFMNMDIQLGGEGGSDYGAGCEWVAPEPDDLKVEAEDWTTVVAAPAGTVSIDTASDSDLSQHVGNFDAGDFIEYAVELPSTACYRAEYRVASDSGSDGFELIFDGETADSFKIAPTGGWSSWVTFTRHYELNEGSQTLRLEALGDSFNINWLTFNETEAVDCEQSAAIIIEAETYSNSVQLPDGEVNTQPSEDEGGGLNVGWIDAGDWMEYELQVSEASNYTVSYRMASQSGSSSGINLLTDGNLVDSIQVPNTGGWQIWQTVEGGNISLEAGDYVLRFEAPGGGLNLNWIKLMPTNETATGNLGTGVDDSLNVGEVINFNDLYVDYDLIDLGDSLSNLEADPSDNTNTVVSILKGAVAQSGVKIASAQVTYPLSETLTRLSMRAYSSAIGTSVRMKLEDSTNSANSVEAEALTTVANEWEILIFDFSNPVDGTAELNTGYNFDTVSVFFNYLSAGNGETYYFDDITMLDEVVEPITLTQEILVGEWKLAPEAGSAGVGWESGNLGWWQVDAATVIDRDCLFDDLFVFSEDGTFTNQMGGSTWIEPWQGVDPEACGTPVAPHDGSGSASYVLDPEAGTITLTGVGAHLGLAKVMSGGDELASPDDAPESIVYKVMASTDNSITVEVAYSAGFWTFKLVASDYVAEVQEDPVVDSDNPRIEAEDWSNVISAPEGEVATENSQDTGGGENVGWIDLGDWMEYSLNISQSGNYQMNYRVASQSGSSPGFKILLDGTWIDQIAVTNTGAWQNWETISGRVIYLDQGLHTLRLEARSGGVNLNWIELVATNAQADPLPEAAPPITASDLVGNWKLAPEAGALSNPYWANDVASVTSRSCLFDDLFIFSSNGAFINQMDGETWVEPWQGVASERCGTPVAPHNGAGRTGYIFDDSAMTITLNGAGAHLGIPKAINGSEMDSPSQTPDSIVYEVIDSTATTMTLNINVSWGDWTFKLIKD
ncbi:MAG: cellulase family glycosylhydrolase [Porticoccaceae bacterium]|nr:cellulase family glycosylhydrolase [Porticoccaceae bacterium]